MHILTTHQTEWDPFAALLEWSNRNRSITSNRNREGKAETWSEKQAGWSGQAADIRVREETVRVGVTSRVSEERGRGRNQETHYGKGKRSEVTAGANQDFAMGECMCAAYSGAKKYLVSHQLWKFSHLKRWERPVIFIIGIPQLWETK